MTRAIADRPITNDAFGVTMAIIADEIALSKAISIATTPQVEPPF